MTQQMCAIFFPAYSYSNCTQSRIRVVQIKYGMHSFRDLDREEGAALHARLFEEALDWYDPFSE